MQRKSQNHHRSASSAISALGTNAQCQSGRPFTTSASSGRLPPSKVLISTSTFRSALCLGSMQPSMSVVGASCRRTVPRSQFVGAARCCGFALQRLSRAAPSFNQRFALFGSASARSSKQRARSSAIGAVHSNEMRPNRSLNRTRYGSRRKPGLQGLRHFCSPVSRRLP